MNDLPKNTRRPLLITGSHRSGTTWAGKIFSASPNMAYVFEPFNVAAGISMLGTKFPNWYYCLNDQNCKEYIAPLENLLAYKYPLIKNILRASSLRDIVKITRDQYLFFGYAHRGSRAIFKDPIAFFSAEWLSKNFDMDVLVMIRHPAAFCSSLKLKDWHFDFNNFTNQPLLMDKYLYPYADEIIRFSKKQQGVIEQGVLLWNCIHHTINTYKSENPGWLFRRHEDLSINPMEEFRDIFTILEVDFTKDVIDKIDYLSGKENPVEQDPNNNFIRNSKLNVNNWLNRLTINEIKFIKEKTFDVSSNFYAEADWYSY